LTKFEMNFVKSSLVNRKQASGFYDFAAAQAVGANADALVGAVHLGVYRAQIDVPAPSAHVVRVADGISGQRLLAADITNLCHDESRFLPDVVVKP